MLYVNLITLVISTKLMIIDETSEMISVVACWVTITAKFDSSGITTTTLKQLRV